MKQFDELVHRVNNLLGTIEVQVEVARAEETLEAYKEAIGYIAESAHKTRVEVRSLVAQMRAAAEPGDESAQEAAE